MAFEQELDIYLRSRFTLMVLVTPEEERALQSVKQVCDRAKRPCLSWDVADGFQVITNWSGSMPSARDPLSALEQVDKARKAGHIAWVQIVAGGRKGQRLEKITDAEWKATLDILSNNKQWEEMWRLAQKTSAIRSKQLLQQLKQAGWLPKEQQKRVEFKTLQQLAQKCSEKIPVMGTSMRCLTNVIRGLHSIYGVSFSPDGQLLASKERNFREEYSVSLWQMPDGKPLGTFPGQYASFSPDGQLLVSQEFNNNIIRVWQMPDGKLLGTLPGQYASFSPDGQLLVSEESNDYIRVWRMPGGGWLGISGGYGGFRLPGQYAGFSPDGQLLVSEKPGEYIKVWRMPSGERLITLSGEDINFSSDRKLLTIEKLKRSIKLWKMPEERPPTNLPEEYASFTHSPDGQMLISIEEDNTIKLWTSDLPRLCSIPVEQFNQQDRKFIQKSSQNEEITKEERHWLELINWYWRFDIEVEDEPQSIHIDEFDIEIEG